MTEYKVRIAKPGPRLSVTTIPFVRLRPLWKRILRLPYTSFLLWWTFVRCGCPLAFAATFRMAILTVKRYPSVDITSVEVVEK